MRRIISVLTMLFFAVGLPLMARPPEKDCSDCIRQGHPDQKPVDMLPFLFFDQNRAGLFHLEGDYITYDKQGDVESLTHMAFLKSYRLSSDESGEQKYLLIKSNRGIPVELFARYGNKIYIERETMDWIANNEWREYFNSRGEHTLEWGRDGIVPYRFVVQSPKEAGLFYRYCDNPSRDVFMPTDVAGYYTPRLFDLTTEIASDIDKELGQEGLIEPAWVDMASALGYPDAHVMMMVIEAWWYPFDPSSPFIKNVNILSNYWGYHERYAYLALQMPDGSTHGIGLVDWTFLEHEDSRLPMRKKWQTHMKYLVSETTIDRVVGRLACE